MRRKKLLHKGWFGSLVSYVYLTVLSVIATFPLIWVVLSSVKNKVCK